MYNIFFLSYLYRALNSEMSVTLPSASSESRFTVHQVATSYMCRFCAKQFVSIREMQLHVLQHSRGNAPLNCAICSKSYRTPSKLQRHVRVHSGERPYICNLCGRRFTRSDHLKQHMKVHSPNRQKNMCRLCNARFTSCSLLGSHLRTHEIHQIHLCRCCGEGFPTSEELDQHKKLHDVKGTIRASRGRRGAAHHMVSDLDILPTDGGGELSLRGDALTEKPNLQGSKWIGCARFCLSQIPVENNNGSGDNNSPGGTTTDNTSNPADKVSKQPSSDQELEPIHEDSGSPDIEILPEDMSKSRRPETDETNDANTRPKMVVSPLSNPPDNSPPGLARSFIEPVMTVTNNTSLLSLPSASCDDMYTSTSANMMTYYPHFKGSANLRALIKREPENLEVHNMSYTRNLLNAPPAITRPLYTPPQYDPRVSFSPYFSASYLEYLYSQSTRNRIVSSSPAGTRCEHCHIWFEDFAMFMLHNSLHSADEADPFTCKKCMKKLGNRLEFTAHLVWHLDPILD